MHHNHTKLLNRDSRKEVKLTLNLPASDPFFPEVAEFDMEISAGGASSVRASLHYKGSTEVSSSLIQII